MRWKFAEVLRMRSAVARRMVVGVGGAL